MKLSRQRKVSFGILALALGALALDRVYLNATSPASAAAATTAPEGSVVATSQPPASASGPTLANRLEALARDEGLTTENVSDLFSDAPVKPWRMTAVMGSGERGAVIVDGARVRVGEAYDGAVLTRVHSKGAVFSRDGEEVEVLIATLELPKDR